jgi:hypothetical protein
MSGASERTLHVRARFYPGGKKGRAAARRLRAMGLTPGYTRDGWRGPRTVGCVSHRDFYIESALEADQKYQYMEPERRRAPVVDDDDGDGEGDGSRYVRAVRGQHALRARRPRQRSQGRRRL